jgi:hypothetical protein
MRDTRPPHFALALCLTAALAACGNSESEVSADASAVDVSSADDGSTSDAEAATPDAAADAGEGSDTWDPESCYIGDDSKPSVLWIGADNVGPCDDPCYKVVSGFVWNDAQQCWGAQTPLACWRSGVAGAEPTCHAVPDTGVIYLNYHYSGIVDSFTIVDCPSPDPWSAPSCE